MMAGQRTRLLTNSMPYHRETRIARRDKTSRFLCYAETRTSLTCYLIHPQKSKQNLNGSSEKGEKKI